MHVDPGVNLTMKRTLALLLHSQPQKKSFTSFSISSWGAWKDALKNTRFHSAKKSHSSINIMIVISITGRILWISRSYPDSFNDSMIISQELEFFRKFDSSEHGFGDGGFRGLSHLGIYTPSSSRDDYYAAFSHHRILIECMIAHLKTFAATREKMTERRCEEDMLQIHQDNWIIASVLVNSHCKQIADVDK